MNRRTLLRRSAALGVLGLAGCTSDANDGNDGEDGPSSGGSGGTDTPTETPTETPTDTSTPAPTVTDYSIRTFETGCKSEDERAAVHKSESEVTITGLITASNPCFEAVLNAVDYTIESDTLRVDVGVERTDDVCADCVGAIEYEATVEFADGPPGSVTVSHDGDRIDAGDIESGSPGAAPTLVESSLSVTNVASTERERTADAEFNPDAGTVVVTGTIQGENGCKTAALGSASYDPGEDQLFVDVVTEDREDAGTCTQQLVYIDYEATFSFERGVASSVSVSHNGQGVMGAAYGSASASGPDN
jgi:hypothetical protein